MQLILLFSPSPAPRPPRPVSGVEERRSSITLRTQHRCFGHDGPPLSARSDLGRRVKPKDGRSRRKKNKIKKMEAHRRTRRQCFRPRHGLASLKSGLGACNTTRGPLTVCLCVHVCVCVRVSRDGYHSKLLDSVQILILVPERYQMF